MIPLPLLQLFCVLGLVVGAAMFRYRLIDEPYSLGLLAVNFLGLVILSIVAIYTIATQLLPLTLQKLLWLGLSLLPIAIAAGLLWQGARVPAIHDISTNTQAPPLFVVAEGLRKPFHNSLDYSPEVAAQQAKAYPDITTQVFIGELEGVLNNVLEVSAMLGWQLHQADLAQGTVEAYVATPLLGFIDDIVISVRQADGEVQVDIRSQSRIGKSDLGANAKRIRLFQGALVKQMLQD